MIRIERINTTNSDNKKFFEKFTIRGGVDKEEEELMSGNYGQLPDGDSASRLKPVDKFIGMQLRRERKKRRMSLADASEFLGVSYQQLQKYEQARSRVAVSTLCKLSELYEFGMSRFFEEVEREVNLFEKKREGGNGVVEDARTSVLVVESNPADEILIQDALRCACDFLNVLCVHDGCQVLDVLKYKTLCPDFPKPAVVFLDMYIPKMDGVAVLKELKRDESTKGIPVVVLSDNVSSDLATKMYKLGAAGYIAKTTDRSSFNEIVSNCIKYWTKTVVVPKTRLLNSAK